MFDAKSIIKSRKVTPLPDSDDECPTKSSAATTPLAARTVGTEMMVGWKGRGRKVQDEVESIS